MDKQELQIIVQSLQQEWGVELSETISEQEIIDRLALQIAAIAGKGPDVFFQLMYRLDIPEKQLINAMHDKEVALQIAKLVYNRQLQKIRSRQYYKGKEGTVDDNLTW
jgi:hypothetical protein